MSADAKDLVFSIELEGNSLTVRAVYGGLTREKTYNKEGMLNLKRPLTAYLADDFVRPLANGLGLDFEEVWATFVEQGMTALEAGHE